MGPPSARSPSFLGWKLMGIIIPWSVVQIRPPLPSEFKDFGTLERIHRDWNQHAHSTPLPLFAGEVGERSETGEGFACCTTLTRVARAP